MRVYYVIQNVQTRLYYCSYRGDDSWTGSIDDANKYKSREEALKEVDVEYVRDFLLQQRYSYVEIKEIVGFE